jgi:hypothetical protein
MVFLLDPPNELVFEIVKNLDQHRDIKSIARVSRECYSFFNDDVYRFNISSRGGRGVLWAIVHDKASAVGKLLDLVLDVNAVPGCNHYSTLLHLTTHYGSLSTVKRLLQRGAHINAKTSPAQLLFNVPKYRRDEVVRAISEQITDIGEVLMDFGRALTPYMQLVDISCRTLQDSFWSLVTTCGQRCRWKVPFASCIEWRYVRLLSWEWRWRCCVRHRHGPVGVRSET